MMWVGLDMSTRGLTYPLFLACRDSIKEVSVMPGFSTRGLPDDTGIPYEVILETNTGLLFIGTLVFTSTEYRFLVLNLDPVYHPFECSLGFGGHLFTFDSILEMDVLFHAAK